MSQITITTNPCPMCKKRSTIEVDKDRYNKWRGGMLIQNAFPEMPQNQRELLITGTHPACWDKMFKPEPPTREERIIDSGYQAYAREEGHYDTGDY